MFHDASAAGSTMRRVTESTRPARNPTRGSGFGADADMFGAGEEATVDDVDVAQPAADRTAIANDMDTSGAAATRRVFVWECRKNISRFTLAG